MRKPILVIRLPEYSSPKSLQEVYSAIRESKVDQNYYTFIITDPKRKYVEFKLFNSKDIKPIKLEKLKKILKLKK